jgi:FMN phosphatase YigB (HAD superfamily)
MAIKAVVFDLGGVLENVQDDAWPQTWIGRWQARMNLPADQVTSVPAGREDTAEMVTGGSPRRRCGSSTRVRSAWTSTRPTR